MAFGYQALGLGSNTTAIGNSSTTATTIYGLLSLASGISAAGATFSGNVTVNSQIVSTNARGWFL